ncbi:MAG: hypothetical protein RI894_2383, partial [Bacteroidota bacterium]
MLKSKKYFLTFALLCGALLSMAQPVNDECANAIDLGSSYFTYSSSDAAFTSAGATASSLG